MTEVKLAFIGGSGVYQMDDLNEVEEIDVETPFGAPSDSFVIGTIEGTRVAFLPRHDRGHSIPPSEIPSRANIYALKTLGVERIVSISAVGSLQEQIRPLDMLVPDQIVDRTKSRPSTFFNDDIVAHVGFSDPFCAVLSDVVAAGARQQSVTTHRGGT